MAEAPEFHDRMLSLGLARVSEAAALASARLIGRGDEKAADQAAVDAMRTQLNHLEIRGVVVIGEGERDEAPMLYIGEKVGTGEGPEVDIAIDFHGAISPQTAKLLVKALEPYQPMFIEEPVQCQNVDVLADIAHSTHIPIATGERLYTKWGFREVLEKRAAMILQPDLCHAGGIFETRLIAGMAEAY